MKIAVGNSRMDKKWKNREMSWEDFCTKVSVTQRTTETVEEYRRLKKGAQDAIKDVGGFVAGHVKDGRRKNGHVLCRSMLTLDMDYGKPGIWDEINMLHDFKCCVYSTHKHTAEHPRLRMILPLSREISEEEYPAVARMVAKEIGIDLFDDTTYEACRLMYWPSTSTNGEFFYEIKDGAPIDPDAYLARYDDWHDTSTWPVSSRQSEAIRRSISEQADPLEKPGVVGAFCRAYSIEDAIEAFLSDVYEPSTMNGRFDYIPADSSAGLVVYDGKFAYSHHATDPVCGKLLNAFDLVRLHRFRDHDDKCPLDTPVGKLPSFKAMSEFAIKDERVKAVFAEERKAQAERDFADEDWESGLELEKNGRVKDTLDNIVLILDNDPKLAVIGYNELKSTIDFLAKPAWMPIKYPTWTDNDASQLRVYLSEVYGIYAPTKTADALNMVAAKRKHHPIRDYLNGLPAWDGQSRLDTLLIDYLGSEDTPYVRAVTRKTLVAAVARVFVPGIKFDSVLVMDGPQEKGKSTLFNLLAGDAWFNDGLTLTDMQDKTGAEKLQGYWIMEIGELTGMRKSDIDSVKSFISRRDDKYRASYGRVVESHPRQAIIIATVNGTGGFLRDPTGNRRFWPVKTPGGVKRHAWDLTETDVDQIWAEALVRWKEGERLFLEGDLKYEANLMQNAALETDEREGMVREYLERLLPEDWDSYDLYARRSFLTGGEFGSQSEGIQRRRYVSTMEIWAECYGKDPSSIRKMDSYEIGVVLRKLDWVSSDKRKRLPIYGQQRVWECDKQI